MQHTLRFGTNWAVVNSTEPISQSVSVVIMMFRSWNKRTDLPPKNRMPCFFCFRSRLTRFRKRLYFKIFSASRARTVKNISKISTNSCFRGPCGGTKFSPGIPTSFKPGQSSGTLFNAPNRTLTTPQTALSRSRNDLVDIGEPKSSSQKLSHFVVFGDSFRYARSSGRVTFEVERTIFPVRWTGVEVTVSTCFPLRHVDHEPGASRQSSTPLKILAYVRRVAFCWRSIEPIVCQDWKGMEIQGDGQASLMLYHKSQRIID